MVMFIKLFTILILLTISNISVFANNTFDLMITNNVDLQERLKFFDNLYECLPFKYHAQPSGIYEIYGKNTNICSVKWSLVHCNFPRNIYPEFAKIQKKRTIQRVERYAKGIMIEVKDKDYRYLYEIGNKYCTFNY